MKKTISIFFSVLFILFSCKQKVNKTNATAEKTTIIQNTENSINDFLGDWEMEDISKDNNDTFSINLSKSKKGELEGQYCAVVRNGNKIDCSPVKEINIIEIKKEENQYVVSFKSFFNATNGEAKISLINGKLHWQVVKKPIGEFYCPIDAYLIKKNTANLTQDKPSNTININSENYKSSDITLSLYKDIIEEYGCGDYSVNGESLGKYNDDEIFIVENNCGDFPFKNLISVKDGKIVDKLLIEMSSFDMEKFENQKIKDETNTSFNIINTSNIQIRTILSVNGKIKSDVNNIYFINNTGKFQKK